MPKCHKCMYRKHTFWSTFVGLVIWVDISGKINDLLSELVFFEKYARNFCKNEQKLI